MSTNIVSLDRATENTTQKPGDIQHEYGWASRDDTCQAAKAFLQNARD